MGVHENLSLDLIRPPHRRSWETEVYFWLHGRKGDEERKQFFACRITIPGFYVITPQKRLESIRRATERCLSEMEEFITQGKLYYQDEETEEFVPFEFDEWWIT